MELTEFPTDVIHHADHGPQYTSYVFVVTAGNENVRLSSGSVGDQFDNAVIEAFGARLKVEIAWIRDGSIRFETRADCHAYLFVGRVSSPISPAVGLPARSLHPRSVSCRRFRL